VPFVNVFVSVETKEESLAVTEYTPKEEESVVFGATLYTFGIGALDSLDEELDDEELNEEDEELFSLLDEEELEDDEPNDPPFDEELDDELLLDESTFIEELEEEELDSLELSSEEEVFPAATTHDERRLKRKERTKNDFMPFLFIARLLSSFLATLSK